MKKEAVLSDHRLKKLVAHSATGIALLDRKLNIIDYTFNSNHILGWKNELLHQTTLELLVHPTQRVALIKLLKEVCSSPEVSRQCDLQFIHLEGHYVWLSCTFSNLLADQDISAIVFNFSESSSEKSTELLLQQDLQQLKLLESVITNTTDAILITDAEPFDDPGPSIIYVNEAFCRMTGYSASEVLGKTPRILQGPKTDLEELKKMRNAMNSWQSCDITVINYKKNGEEFWIHLTITPVADERGWFTHWISVDRDVTERIRAERESTQLFALAPDVICIVSVDGYFKKINPALCQLLEYTEEELLAMPIVKIIHPDEQVKIMTDLEVSNKGNATFYFENRCVTKTGNVKWLAWTSTPANEDGLIFTVAKDITDKKELEDLLHKATNLAGIGGWDLDLIKNTSYWSPITKKIYEVDADYEPEYLSGIEFYKDKREQAVVRGHVEAAINHGIPFDFEMQIVTARNHQKWVRVIGEPEFVGSRCVRIRGSFQDIDDRKKTEILAKESLEEKNLILESIGDAFFAVDKNWIVTYWNKVAEVVLYRPKAELLGKNLWTVFSDSVDSQSYKCYHLAISSQKPVHFDDYYAPLGKWYEISAYPSANGLSVYFKDITDRKATENQLIESEKRYMELFQFSPLPKWVYDRETLVFLDVNHAAQVQYGYTREEFLVMTIKDIRSDQEWPILEEALKRGRSIEDSFNVGTFSHQTKAGKIIQVEIQSNPIIFRGRSAKVVSASDITERLTYIKAIEDQNTTLREISWIHSHLVRAPLARILGLTGLLAGGDLDLQESIEMMEYLNSSAKELDEVIIGITEKALPSISARNGPKI